MGKNGGEDKPGQGSIKNSSESFSSPSAEPETGGFDGISDGPSVGVSDGPIVGVPEGPLVGVSGWSIIWFSFSFNFFTFTFRGFSFSFYFFTFTFRWFSFNFFTFTFRRFSFSFYFWFEFFILLLSGISSNSFNMSFHAGVLLGKEFSSSSKYSSTCFNPSLTVFPLSSSK